MAATTPAFENFSYKQLIVLVPGYLERKDDAFKAQMPVFISLAENRVATDLKTQGFLTVAANRFEPGQAMVKKPAFWRETVAFGFTKSNGEFGNLFLRPLEYVRSYWPDPTLRDEPVYYADYNVNFFYIAPTPAVALPFELSFFARLQPLSVANDSNWMTTYMPQVLFYATCLEAAVWLKNKDREGTFQAQYNQVLTSLSQEGKERLNDRNQAVT